MEPKKTIVIRNGLILAAITGGGTLRVPTTEDIEGHIVPIASKEVMDGKWLLITKSTGCPPGCSFVPPLRLQNEDAENADDIGEVALCSAKAA